jgi:hypothetical protein
MQIEPVGLLQTVNMITQTIPYLCSLVIPRTINLEGFVHLKQSHRPKGSTPPPTCDQPPAASAKLGMSTIKSVLFSALRTVPRTNWSNKRSLDDKQSGMEAIEPDIRKKLTKAGYTRNNMLPSCADSADWNLVRDHCSLSNPELIKLKNRVIPHQSGNELCELCELICWLVLTIIDTTLISYDHRRYEGSKIHRSGLL